MPVQTDTKERILETALKHFADKGFEGTSLRAVTAEAGVNLAAIHYHFGSKENLFAEVFGRLLGPVNRERIDRLDRIEEQAAGGPPPLEEVVEAFIAPPLLTWHERGGIAVRLLGRIHAESTDLVRRTLMETFGEVMDRFTAALRRALPELHPREVCWRLLFSVGAMAHTMAMATHDMERAVRPELAEPTRPEDLIRRLLPFLCAGFLAPTTETRHRRRK